MSGSDKVKFVLSTDFGKTAAAGLVVEGVKAVSENHGNLLAGVLDLAMAEDDETALDNPLFTDHGHDGPSPKTQQYLQSTKAFGALGTIATSLADLGGYTSGLAAAQHFTVWCRINALFEQMIPPSRRAKPPEYAAWYSYVVAKKAVPAGSLEIQMRRIIRQKLYSTTGGAAKTAIALGTGGLIGVFVNAGVAQIQEKLNSLFGQDVITLAQGLHWKAYRESVVGAIGGRGGVGPGMRILEVIWQQFSYGRAASVSLADVIREPQGWMVVATLLA